MLFLIQISTLKIDYFLLEDKYDRSYLYVAGLFHKPSSILFSSVPFGQLHPKELQSPFKVCLQKVLLGSLQWSTVENYYKQRTQSYWDSYGLDSQSVEYIPHSIMSTNLYYLEEEHPCSLNVKETTERATQELTTWCTYSSTPNR